MIAAIQAQRAILADASAAPQSRREALKFLVHLVADVHQPLHASPIDDKGGNFDEVAPIHKTPPPLIDQDDTT